ncbi:MAG: histidine phosphatase family protein [Roseivivax sp.]|nr:histidine phosphatase family protein [Roseivivax sp.]
MSQITLVRHGQANNTARDEAGYDRLSPLGHQQAGWLGGYFRSAGERFARVYCGTLRRHVETAQGIGLDLPVVQDARLNELEYFTMAALYRDQHGVDLPTDREQFVFHLPRLFEAWRDGALDGVPEPFEHFETRIAEVLHDIAGGDGPALVVTSGGVIGFAMRATMRLDMAALVHTILNIQNTSLHRWTRLPTGLALTQFNATPHLDTIERRHAQTHL